MTVTHANAVNNDASPDATNASTHSPNATTTPDAAATIVENKMSVRQLLDGQEYHVAKCDIIKNVLFPYQTPKHQYYEQWCFRVDPFSQKTFRYDKLYHICWKWTKTILCSLAWSISNIGLFELHLFWRRWTDKPPKLIIN